MGSGRPRWKLSFRRSGSSAASNSSSSSPASSVKSESFAVTPPEFLCPVSNSLMADPVILSTGHTFERACIEACSELSFSPPSVSPPLEFDSSPAVLIPNVALKAAIVNWCDRAGLPRPVPLSPESAHEIVKSLMPSDQHVEMKDQNQKKSLSVRTPKGISSFSCISNSSLSSNSHLSSSSSASTSSFYPPCETPKTEFSKEEEPRNKQLSSPSSPTESSTDWLEDEILLKLRDFDLSDDQDEVLLQSMVSLHQATRESQHRRLSLCTPRLLSALHQILFSQDSTIVAHASASLANLSTEPQNKIPIVRAGIIPPLIEILKKGSYEARENAAGCVFSLALEEENRAAIGALCAIPPLVSLFCHKTDGSDRIRRDSGCALYHLSLSNTNRSKIARSAGAVRRILQVAISSDESPAIRKLSMMIICNLSSCNEGRASLLDAGAISAITGLIEKKSQEEHSLLCLYELSKGSMRFRGLAKAAGAEKVLEGVVEREEGVRKEMARKVLKVVSGDGGERGRMGSMRMDWFESDEIEEVYDQSVSVVSEGMSSFRRRFGEIEI